MADQASSTPREHAGRSLLTLSQNRCERLGVRGLAFIGHIEKDVEFCGHTFTAAHSLPLREGSSLHRCHQPWRGSHLRGAGGLGPETLRSPSASRP